MVGYPVSRGCLIAGDPEEVRDLGQLVLRSCPPLIFALVFPLFAFGGEVLIGDDVRFDNSTHLPIPINEKWQRTTLINSLKKLLAIFVICHQLLHLHLDE